MSISDRAGSVCAVLRDRFPDAIVGPGDPGWDSGRMSFNLLNDQRPEAVARPSSAPQTAEVVRAARDLGLRLHVQGSSHNTLPAGSLEGTLLIRLDRMTAVEIDVEAQIASVEAGARWWDVVPRASALGLSALHGSSPEVNVVGYSLGGGLGWQGRKHGLQANSLTAIEVVTADGEQLRVDAENGADLFWALRGGSGNFAVVTKIEFRLYPVDAFYAGALFFGIDQAAEVLHAWREWTRQAPEEVTTCARILKLPDLEPIPEIVRGKSFTVINGAFLGDEEDGAELLRPLRELGPQMDTFAMVPPAGLSDLHMDPVDPLPYLSAHSLVDGLPAQAIDDAVAIARNGFDSLVTLELRHGGGALSRTAPGHGAIESLPGEYLMFMVALVLDPAEVPVLEADLARLAGVFAQHDVGRYLNFTEQAHDVEAMFPAGTLPRLRELKAKWDPDNAIRANHDINGSGA
jgi:UDP-N-acetylenolpyruvoylglucosamine reductase